MRAALSLLFFSAVLFLPCVAPAAEPAQAKIEAGVSEPATGPMARMFGWFRSLGNLKIEGDVADDQSRRYQDGQYVYWNGGSKGYHFVADLAPDLKPGFYMRLKGDGPLSAELSMEDPMTTAVEREAHKPGNPGSFCMFLGPDFDPAFSDGRDKGLGPDMPALDTHPGADPGTDLGIRCGVSWKFN